jgi:hypothetical protein
MTTGLAPDWAFAPFAAVLAALCGMAILSERADTSGRTLRRSPGLIVVRLAVGQLALWVMMFFLMAAFSRFCARRVSTSPYLRTGFFFFLKNTNNPSFNDPLRYRFRCAAPCCPSIVLNPIMLRID